MAEPALQTARNAPNQKVLVGGSELAPDVAVSLLETRVTEHVDGPSMFSLMFNNWKSDQQEFKDLENVLAFGAQVEVKVGYVDTMESLVLGEVASLAPEYSENAAPTLTVHGFDLLHRLVRGRRSKVFTNMTDSEIAEQIARDRQLNAEVESSAIRHEHVYQHNQTDLDFLMARAARIGFEVLIEGRALVFRKFANNKDKVVTLEHGLTLKKFYSTLSTVRQVSKVKVQGWDPEKKEEIVGEAGKGDENSLMGGATLGAEAAELAFFSSDHEIVNFPVLTENEALELARGRFNDLAAGYVRGEGTAIGNTLIRAGSVIELKGLGQRFAGKYYIVSATHTINASGYTTKFTVQRNAA